MIYLIILINFLSCSKSSQKKDDFIRANQYENNIIEQTKIKQIKFNYKNLEKGISLGNVSICVEWFINKNFSYILRLKEETSNLQIIKKSFISRFDELKQDLENLEKDLQNLRYENTEVQKFEIDNLKIGKAYTLQIEAYEEDILKSIIFKRVVTIPEAVLNLEESPRGTTCIVKFQNTYEGINYYFDGVKLEKLELEYGLSKPGGSVVLGQNSTTQFYEEFQGVKNDSRDIKIAIDNSRYVKQTKQVKNILGKLRSGIITSHKDISILFTHWKQQISHLAGTVFSMREKKVLIKEKFDFDQHLQKLSAELLTVKNKIESNVTNDELYEGRVIHNIVKSIDEFEKLKDEVAIEIYEGCTLGYSKKEHNRDETEKNSSNDRNYLMNQSFIENKLNFAIKLGDETTNGIGISNLDKVVKVKNLFKHYLGEVNITNINLYNLVDKVELLKRTFLNIETQLTKNINKIVSGEEKILEDFLTSVYNYLNESIDLIDPIKLKFDESTKDEDLIFFIKEKLFKFINTYNSLLSFLSIESYLINTIEFKSKNKSIKIYVNLENNLNNLRNELRYLLIKISSNIIKNKLLYDEISAKDINDFYHYIHPNVEFINNYIEIYKNEQDFVNNKEIIEKINQNLTNYFKNEEIFSSKESDERIRENNEKIRLKTFEELYNILKDENGFLTGFSTCIRDFIYEKDYNIKVGKLEDYTPKELFEEIYIFFNLAKLKKTLMRIASINEDRYESIGNLTLARNNFKYLANMVSISILRNLNEYVHIKKRDNIYKTISEDDKKFLEEKIKQLNISDSLFNLSRLVAERAEVEAEDYQKFIKVINSIIEYLDK